MTQGHSGQGRWLMAMLDRIQPQWQQLNQAMAARAIPPERRARVAELRQRGARAVGRFRVVGRDDHSGANNGE